MLSGDNHLGASENADCGSAPQTHCFKTTEIGWDRRNEGEKSLGHSDAPI